MSLRVITGLAVAAAGCPKTAQIATTDAPYLDADLSIDAPQPPYSHTISLDGSNDFAAGEVFATTTVGYAADVAWDGDNVYLGYTGTDLATTTVDASTKWLFAYVDVDPGNATGALVTQTYNTQHASLPVGFGAELYFRWKCDGTFTTIEAYDTNSPTLWTTSSTTPSYAQAGDFLEVALPRSLFGGTKAIGVVTYMINEGSNVESSYAGLYVANFVDGYGSDLTISKYLRADFTSSSEPDDPTNEAPPEGPGSGSET